MPTARVSIVGLGPKGLYCLERLLAEFHARPLRHPLHIDVFNRSEHFGAGPIYDPAQPDHILVNNSVGDIDLWTVEDPPIAAGRGPSFLGWYQDAFDPDRPLTGDEYLPRAVVGRYLIDGFRRLIDHLPTGVTASCHVGDVVDIRPNEHGYDLEFVARSGDTKVIVADKVLLATGHSRIRPGTEQDRYQAFATRNRARPIHSCIRSKVDGLDSSRRQRCDAGRRSPLLSMACSSSRRTRWALRAIGERFAFLHASGTEPRSIVAFSRTGLPMTPRPATCLPARDL